ncbi:type II toxin-antitoxin system RelE/ParE family toxin [Desulfonatronum sp. SC1]|uniref:type II toxin-antitoxin system RelE/ParE family toxin n=1 Tax=Desulfonatronum sp. SC1 TaxID=2109626 RepID=UPI000D3280F0|nr:type II toxin-antitoxin system RelE/ParE family toxin [Desulfonatronum sp. SC1]PTN33504.1 type II toxin-antitoxin system RelE/ParE family toxin [Desulfonatronum sp. SC1]
MKLLVLACAEDEFAEAVNYYNGQCPGLGYEFAAEVRRCFERIRRHPDAWPAFTSRTKRCLMNRFPYGVLYRAEGDSIIVGAIMHLKRNPILWRKRAHRAFGDQNRPT